MKTVYFLLLTLIFTSCVKPLEDKQVINVTTSSGSFHFASAKLYFQDFCELKLYTIEADQSFHNKLLISFTCDTLRTGSYEAGLSYWGAFQFTNEIRLNVTYYRYGIFRANFNGKQCQGVIVIDHQGYAM